MKSISLTRLRVACAIIFFTIATMKSATTVRGASIGVNFGDASFALAAGDSAGYIPQVNWQNVTASSATALTLSDNTAAATTAALTFTGTTLPSIQAASAVDGPDELLNNSSVASFTAPMTLSVTGVPYASYDVIAYVFTAFSSSTYSANIGATTLWGKTPTSAVGSGYIDDNNSTPFNYLAAVGTTAGTATAGGNYYLFGGLSGGSFTLTMDASNAVPYITAMQIIEVPEPNSCLLLFIGGCVLGLRYGTRLCCRDGRA